MIFFLVMLVAASSAFAQVYRCTTTAGKVEYSDAPCQASRGEARLIAPPVSESEKLRRENEELRRQVDAQNKIMRNQAAAPPANAVPAPAPAPVAPPIGRTQADVQADRADTPECARAKREYEIALSSIAGRNTSAAAEAAMQSACGMRTPDRTIININRGPTNCTRVGSILSCH